jgi:AcrR family transcriptional regulator
MRVSESREPQLRGSGETWLSAAYQSLVESGVDAVRIGPLAKKVKLSRTSFYWFFRDRDTLLSVLLERWRTKNTGNLIRQTQAYAETITEGIFNVFDCWLDSRLFDPGLEFAVRSWAQQSEEVAGEIRDADAARITALTDMFVRFGFKSHVADVRARTTYLSQIGYISMKTTEEFSARMSRIPEYVEIFTGAAPLQRELERFFARHGYVTRKGSAALASGRRKSR